MNKKIRYYYSKITDVFDKKIFKLDIDEYKSNYLYDIELIFNKIDFYHEIFSL